MAKILTLEEVDALLKGMDKETDTDFLDINNNIEEPGPRYKTIEKNLYNKDILYLNKIDLIESNISNINPELDIVISIPNNNIIKLNLDGGISFLNDKAVNLGNLPSINNIFYKYIFKPKIKLSIPDGIILDERTSNSFTNCIYKNHKTIYKSFTESELKEPYYITHKIYSEFNYTLYIDIFQFKTFDPFVTLKKEQSLLDLYFSPVYSLSKYYFAQVGNIYIIENDEIYLKFETLFGE